MKLLSLLTLILCPFLAIAEPEEKAPAPIKHIDAKAASKLLEEKDKAKLPVILDIRTPTEFNKGHIEKAKNIDYIADTFEEEIAKLDKDKPYLLHCRSGGRSNESLIIFKKLGFRNIYHLDGGIIAWEKEKFKVVE